MLTVHELSGLRQWRADMRSAGKRVAFVPTMGNLHRGHFSLVEQARESADAVVASIFVNPTQFGPNEDFASYPRTLSEDQAGLAAAGCDLVFAPDVATMYPIGVERTVRMEVPDVSTGLCGDIRPGHFAGVATVVARLFNMVQPETAWFGRKDFQQVLVIRRMVEDLSFPIDLRVGDTVREANGLAMSSRNAYLTNAEREQAAEIFRTLTAVTESVRAGRRLGLIETAAVDRLQGAGFRVDYVSIRRAADLSVPTEPNEPGLVVLAAARLGKARLIDNLLI
ncbi:pantoate--beta-alanine ligase [Ahniella affigens]|uniref:Pantothenate synthetase n=1 Tax=Ahniella affigens TaxID=2021234 RepID=A0A2P1PPV9_9GAMM|nr:pantoate--beta-alanine ligase [Ahniella affigens]AVP96874.1 pantoate--beta-alanine ligase [Ahniella affigens]